MNKYYNYIHIPRTGGTSVRRACANNEYILNREHLYATDPVYNKHSTYMYTCRNPYDRLVSAFEFLKSREYINYEMDFKNFVNVVVSSYMNHQMVLARRNLLIMRMLDPQILYIPEGLEANEFRFETLEIDFNKFMKDNGLVHEPLEKHNTINKIHDDWSLYYDDETRSRVSDWYSTDFDRFNYNI